MANNYTLFSEGYNVNSPEEMTWWMHTLNAIHKYLEDFDKGVAGLDDELLHYLDNQECTGFQYTIDNDVIIFFAEESGDTTLIEMLVQRALKKFNPDGCWCITVAFICDKPRVGEFGGAAVFVTADDISWVNTHAWVADRVSGHNKRIRCKGCAHCGLRAVEPASPSDMFCGCCGDDNVCILDIEDCPMEQDNQEI